MTHAPNKKNQLRGNKGMKKLKPKVYRQMSVGKDRRGDEACHVSGSLLTNTPDTQKAHPLLRRRRIWNQRFKRSKTPFPSSRIGS